ncbi:MAG: PhoU domain-containing protein [Methanimicrococcus sp.]|nr:PhoU domain-containing protein [Methanimicrococcus sp.]
MNLRKDYELELSQMRNNVILMSRTSIEMFEQCLSVFFKENDFSMKQLEDLQKKQELLEKEIKKAATSLITRQQPVAKDTREVICAIRIATNWLKICSHITDISEYAAVCPQKIMANSEEENILLQLNSTAAEMLQGTSDAYKTRDTNKAIAVAKTDDLIDQTFWDIRNNILSGGQNASYSICALMIAEHIERIADHAANICEEIVYLENYELVKLN